MLKSVELNREQLKEIEAQIPGIMKLGLKDALQKLHQLERSSRISENDQANRLVCETIAKMCINAKQWDELKDNIAVLASRNGAFSGSITCVIDMAMEQINNIGDEQVRLNFILKLVEVTSGKLFVELQRAVLTRYLVDYHESRKEYNECINLIQDLKLEVLSSMDEYECVSLMLRQLQYCLIIKDSFRAGFCVEKITQKRCQIDELLLIFYKYLLQYHGEFTKDFLELARTHYNIYSIIIKEDTIDKPLDPEKVAMKNESLTHAVINLLMAPRTPEQVRFCEEVSELRDLSFNITAKHLLNTFMGTNLITFPVFWERFGNDIPQEFKDTMRIRVVEHGLRIISGFYSRISLQKLAKLLAIGVDELEQRIIDLVFNEKFYARIDRPNKIVTFKVQKKVSEVADEFSRNVAEVCKLVDHAHYLIEKEKLSYQKVKD